MRCIFVVKIELLELTDKIVKYKYIPENSDEYGIVSFDRVTGEKKIDKLVSGYSMNYPAHAFHRIKEYLENNNFQKKDVIAWY